MKRFIFLLLLIAIPVQAGLNDMASNMTRHNQTITYGTEPTSTITAENTESVGSATASSGLGVTYSTSSSSSICTVSGTTITAVGAGSCVVTASQTGNVHWFAAPTVNSSTVTVTVIGCSGSTPTCMGRETFNGCNAGCTSGCDNSWVTENGTFVCNDTTSPAPLEGTQSAGGTTAGANIMHTVITTAQNSLYVAMKIYITTDTSAYPDIIELDDTSGNTLVTINGVGAPSYVGKNTGGTSSAAFSMPTGSVMYVKLYGSVGTGANAQMQWWTSTNGTVWTSRGSSANGTWTAQIKRVLVTWRACNMVIDDIRWNANDINY